MKNSAQNTINLRQPKLDRPWGQREKGKKEKKMVVAVVVMVMVMVGVEG
jgi:hypothetical protein